MTSESSVKYVDVAPAIPLPPASSQTYTYAVPAGQDTPELFTRVTIPFGKRTVTGIVVRHSRKPGRFTAKPLQPYSTLQLTAHQAAFAQWIARTMHGGVGFTLRLFYPAAKKLPAAAMPTASTPVAPAAIERALATLVPPDTRLIIEADFKKRIAAIRALLADSVPVGQQALIIVPERWMVDRLLAEVPRRDRAHWFGVESHQSPATHTRAWAAVQRGDARVVVGTQKALFLPYRQLGAIVVEEEFYGSHKLWDQYPRLHNVVSAEVLAGIHSARLVYAASFLSTRLAHKAQQKNTHVIANHPTALRTEVIAASYNDMEKRRLLPQEFASALQRWLKRGERVFIMHNARGTWRTVACAQCHEVLRCLQCGVGFSLHEHAAKATQLQCHHCGQTAPLPQACPKCKTGTLRSFGAGIERAGATVQALAPAATFLQLDADTIDDTSEKPAALSAAHPRGLVVMGTIKALRVLHDASFDRVVYLFPERGLLYPDFRSEERVYSLLVRLQQLSPPRRPVTVVTRRAPLIGDTLALPPERFLARQLRERARLQYPPYRDSIVAIARGKTADSALRKAAGIRTQIEERLAASGTPDITVRGPFKPFVTRSRGLYEARLLLLGSLAALTPLYQGLAIDVLDVYPERIL